MAVDETWQNQIPPVIRHRQRRRHRALTDRGDHAAADRDITIGKNRIRGDNGSSDHTIEWD